MTNGFDGFIEYADARSRECEVAAEAAIENYKNADGTFNAEDVLNAAYAISRASALELIRQYHDWTAER